MHASVHRGEIEREDCRASSSGARPQRCALDPTSRLSNGHPLVLATTRALIARSDMATRTGLDSKLNPARPARAVHSQLCPTYSDPDPVAVERLARATIFLVPADERARRSA